MQSEKNSVNVKKSLFIFNIAIPFGGNYLKKIIRKNLWRYRCEDVYDSTVYNSKMMAI